MSTTTVKERPILFSGPMVRAILEGRKTQTRRVCKPQPVDEDLADDGDCFFLNGVLHRQTSDAGGINYDAFSPYGQPGDRLYVKETWRPFWHPELFCSVQYAADSSYRKPEFNCENRGHRFADLCELSGDNAEPWHPSIHMWREMSRLTLEVVSVRVERLQSISDEDALAEGIQRFTKDDKVFKFWPCDPCEGPMKRAWQDLPRTAVEAYAALWDSINAKTHPWASNPWVWVVTFKRV